MAEIGIYFIYRIPWEKYQIGKTTRQKWKYHGQPGKISFFFLFPFFLQKGTLCDDCFAKSFTVVNYKVKCLVHYAKYNPGRGLFCQFLFSMFHQQHPKNSYIRFKLRFTGIVSKTWAIKDCLRWGTSYPKIATNFH